MSDLVGNPEDWFSHDGAQLITDKYVSQVIDITYFPDI